MEKEKWINSVFESIQGSKRAHPRVGLFQEIESQVRKSEASVIPIAQLKLAVAAAIILLFLNVFTIQQNIQSNEISAIEETVEFPSQQIISNYKLYD